MPGCNKYPLIDAGLHNFYDRTPKSVLMEMLVDCFKLLNGEEIKPSALLNELEQSKKIIQTWGRINRGKQNEN